MPANDSARSSPVITLALGAIFLALFVAARSYEVAHPPELISLVRWVTLSDARAAALTTNKPILLVFVRQRDLASRELERNVLSDPEIAAKINRTYVPVKVIDRSNTGRRNDPSVAALATQYRIGRYPALVATSPHATNDLSLDAAQRKGAARFFINTAAAKVVASQRDVRDEVRAAKLASLGRISSATSPSFSADGSEIAYVSDLGGTPQLWRIPATGGYPQLVASVEAGIAGAQWSPRGDWIAFSSNAEARSAPQIYLVRPDGSDLHRITSGSDERNIMAWWTSDGRLPISSWRRASASMESWIYDPAKRTATSVITTPEFNLLIDSGCESRGLLLQRSGNLRTTSLVTLPLASRPRLIQRVAPGEQTTGRIDCQSNTLLGFSDVGLERAALVSVSLATPDFGKTSVLWRRDDAELVGGAFSSDLSMIAVVWERDGVSELWLYDRSTGARRRVNVPLTSIGSVVFSPDGERIAFTGSTPTRAADIWSAELSSAIARQVTRSSHPGVTLDALITPELVAFNGRDGLRLTGWLYRARTSRGAAVISLHGGPAQQERPLLDSTFQALLEAGISVLAPNVRGSAGYGKQFVALDDLERRSAAVDDVRAAAELLLRMKIAKPGHIGVMGSSYGGYLALMATARYPETFAAVVDQYGMFDLAKMIEQAPDDVASMLEAEYGSLARDEKLLEELSPSKHFAQIKAPTLVLHGARDTVVDPWHSTELTARLRRRGVPTEYIVFPDEGHIFRREANRIRATLAITDWFEKYL